MKQLSPYWSQEDRTFWLPYERFDFPLKPEQDGVTYQSAEADKPAYFSQGVSSFAGYLHLTDLAISSPGTAILSRGAQAYIHTCHILDCVDAILLEKCSEVQSCEIQKFSSDAIRYCGDGTRIRGNYIHNPAPSDRKAHVDAIQGYAGAYGTGWRAEDRYEGCHTLRGCLIEDNTIEAGEHAALQGITFFDGLWADNVVRNNSISVRNTHAITLNGASDCFLEHNTILGGQININPVRKQLPEGMQYVGEDWKGIIYVTEDQVDSLVMHPDATYVVI